MKALFYILILVVIATALWQFFKLLGLFKKEQTASEKENNINGWLMLGLGAFIYGLMLYSMVQGRVVLLPRQSASLEGEHIDNLFVMTMGLIFVVQFITQFLIYYFTFKYRGVKGKKATFYADSHKLEMWWTITPTIVLSVLIIYGLWTWNNVQDLSTAENPLIIEVYAKQFQWEARYAGEDNQLGIGNVRFIKGINTMGVDMTDLNSADDIPVRELYLPKGRKVIFRFRSQDVLHSAYMPHFRAQINCVPGMITTFGFTPSVTTLEMRDDEDTIAKFDAINELRAERGEDAVEFDYLLLCNKICGSSHYNMQMKVTVVEEEDFNGWIKNQKTLAQVLN
jgi:cytochrome c oxidase subunit 2